MRKVLVSMLAVVSFAAHAQKFNVETAAIEVKHYEGTTNLDEQKGAIEQGKAAIDKAYTNPESQQDAKMWFLRGRIYTIILTDTNLKGMIDAKSLDVAKEAWINCIQKDGEKKKYSNDARFYLCASTSVLIYNQASNLAANQHFTEALADYKTVTGLFQYDNGNYLKKSNIDESSLYFLMGTICYQAAMDTNNTAAQRMSFLKDGIGYIQTSIDKGYADPVTYVYMSGMLIETGDTARALQVIETGRERFSSEPKLIEAEINIYIAQQRVDVLVKKLDVAIEANPDKEIYYYVRGNSYQNLARREAENGHRQDSILNNLNKQIKSTADPKKKAALQAKANEQKTKVDKSKALYDLYSANSVKDYRKALELNDGLFDAYYGLAAYYLDMAAPYTQIMNDPNASAKAYEDAEKAQAQFYRSALTNFEAGLNVLQGETKTRIDLYYQMFKINARINEVEKAKEYKNKYEELKRQYEAGEVK